MLVERDRVTPPKLKLDLPSSVSRSLDEKPPTSEHTRFELLVIGIRNRTPVGKLLLGSVSQQVLCHAPCSVLVVRGPADT